MFARIPAGRIGRDSGYLRNQEGRNDSVITIVSGLPRSGTSLMMQMLAAGGLPVLTDQERKPDTDNPRGYLEWEPAKLLPKQPDLIAQAEGKVVKVISQLLMALPDGHEYRVVFMERPMPEVLASQDEMLRRRGTTDFVSHDVMTNAFQGHLKKVNAWLEAKAGLTLLRIGYGDLLRDPLQQARAVQKFTGHALDVEAMARQVDPNLYRNRAQSLSS
jgi:hypothetical protein